MTEVWVLTRHNAEYHETSVVAVAASLEAAQRAATEDLDPGWPALEWVQQHNRPDWTTYHRNGHYYTAEPYDVTT